LRYGKHVELFCTDQRQYRADHLIPEGVGADFSVGKFIDYTMVGARYLVKKDGFDPKEADAKPTMLGATQKAWFLDAVKKSNATWKVWGNEVQVYQMLLDLRLLPGVPDKIWSNPDIAPYIAYVNCDQWDGYRSERAEILKALSDAKVQNLLVCTGDIHSFWAAELHVDFDNPGATPVGVEYVTAGISSASLKELFQKFVPSDASAIHDALQFVINAWTGAADGVIKTSCNVNGEYLKYADSDAYGFALMSIDATKAECQLVETGPPTNMTYGGVVSRTKFVTMAGTNKVTKIA